MQPLISIICPIYNCEEFLPACLDSILQQNYANWELILIDDGSEDKTLAICNQYTQKDSRIKILTQGHKGTSKARNYGLQVAKGEYVLFVDGDDYIDPDHIEILYARAKEYDADISIGSMTVFDIELNRDITKTYLQSPKTDGLLSKEQAFENMIYRRGFGGEIAAKLFKSSLIKNLRFDENETIGEDFSFNCQSLHLANKIVFTYDISYHYIRHLGSSTRVKDPDFFEKRIIAAEKLAKFIKKFYPNLKQAQDVFYVFTVFGILHSYIKMPKRNFAKEQEYKKMLRSKLKNVILSPNLPLSFKLQLIILSCSVRFYALFRYIYIYMRKNYAYSQCSC